jgi:hypothetical protein
MDLILMVVFLFVLGLAIVGLAHWLFKPKEKDDE